MADRLCKLWWVPDDVEVWTLADKVSEELPNGCVNFMVHKSKRMVPLPIDKCLPADVNQQAPEDLVFLPSVNPANILICARNRFLEKKIYTNIGMVLMSINPFEVIPGLYGKKMMKMYENALDTSLPAHVYCIPSRAYHNMCTTGKDQSLLISGESGAGKTEAAKQSLAFLTEVANFSLQKSRQANEASGRRASVTGSSTSERVEIAERIIAASPILEAFGNAKTSRNPNSSRFGKWMVLNFDKQNVIHSSNIVSYLLEKSRVTQRDPKERNYHIFYQLLRGLPDEELEKYEMTRNTRDYRFLVANGEEEAIDLNDYGGFNETYQSFLTMGFTKEEVGQIFKLTLGVLELGNVVFRSTRDGETSEIANMDPVERAAKKLGVDANILGYSLCHRSIESGNKLRKSFTTIPLKVQKAQEARDTLARTIYEKLFLEIIHGINSKSKEGGANGLTSMTDRCIGLLDIFGFEIFVENSFEQLCINYCNEMLQNHFNFVIFIAEKNLYDQENIKCDTFEFKDNINVIKDIELLFKALDEEARIPNGTSKTWYDKSKRGFKSSHVTFPPRRQGDIFVVKHYAGDVDYNAMGFLEKNVETINNDLVGTMTGSSDSMILKMFTRAEEQVSPREETPAPTGRRQSASSSINNKSLSWRFQSQLHSLMGMLKKTQSHFIRCIKSNDSCKSQLFESQIIYRQLIYSGVFEVVKIQQSGLPCRMPHYDFLERFKCLASSKVRYSSIKTSTDLVKCLNQHKVLDLSMTRPGRSMMFLKSHEQRGLEIKRDELLMKSSSRISCFLLMKHVRYHFRLIRQYFRDFKAGNEALSSEPATIAFVALSDKCGDLHKLLRRPALEHLIKKLKRELDFLDQRVELIGDANYRLTIRTQEGVLSLDEIMERAVQLELLWHPVIITCKDRIDNYQKTLAFMEIVSKTYEEQEAMLKTGGAVSGTIDATMNALSMEEVMKGIHMLEEYLDFLPAGRETLVAALAHQNRVMEENEHLLKPMEECYHLSVTQYDPATGNIDFKFGDDGFAAYTQLKEVIINYGGDYQFLCADTAILFEDCRCFVKLMEDFVSAEDATSALDWIKHSACSRPENVIFKGQMEEFEKWAEIQLSPSRLNELLLIGSIPRADVAVSSNKQEVAKSTSGLVLVTYEDIEKLVNKLKQLTEPSVIISKTISAGEWIVKLRKAFMEQKWDYLEQLVVEADAEGCANCIFDPFPSTVEELNTAQWQVLYHSFLADVLYSINDGVFVKVTLKSESWLPLVNHLKEDMQTIEDVQAFINDAEPSATPRLQRLLPILRCLLQLHSLVYQKEMDLAKALINEMYKLHSKTMAEFHLAAGMDTEIEFCQILIMKYIYEQELIQALSLDPGIAYPFPPPGSHLLTCDETKSTYGSLKHINTIYQGRNESKAAITGNEESSNHELDLVDKYVNNHPSYASLYDLTDSVKVLKTILQNLDTLGRENSKKYEQYQSSQADSSTRNETKDTAGTGNKENTSNMVATVRNSSTSSVNTQEEGYFHHELNVRIKVARIILSGRESLIQDEVAIFQTTLTSANFVIKSSNAGSGSSKTPTKAKTATTSGPTVVVTNANKIRWDEKMAEFTKAYDVGISHEIAFANAQKAKSIDSEGVVLNETGKKKVKGQVAIWEKFSEEYWVIRHELFRRYLLQELLMLLFMPTIQGEIDLNVHVEEAMLIEQLNHFNDVVKSIQTSINHDATQYPPPPPASNVAAVDKSKKVQSTTNVNAPNSSPFCPGFSLPLNLQALVRFTSELLKLRRFVFDHKSRWEDNDIHRGQALQVIDLMEKRIPHGGALWISNVTNELLRVKHEIYVQDCVKSLKRQLEEIKVQTVDDQSNMTNVDSLFGGSTNHGRNNSFGGGNHSQPGTLPPPPHANRRKSISSHVEVDLSTLRHAMVKLYNHHRQSPNLYFGSGFATSSPSKKLTSGQSMNLNDMKHLGTISQRLLRLGESVIQLMELLIANRIANIQEGTIDKIQDEYHALSLQSKHIGIIFNHIHMHHFIKQLSAILAEQQEHPKALFDQIAKLKGAFSSSKHLQSSAAAAADATVSNTTSGSRLPERFVPWLTIGLLFVEVSNGLYQEKNWVHIIEACRKLDEYLQIYIAPVMSPLMIMQQQHQNAVNRSNTNNANAAVMMEQQFIHNFRDITEFLSIVNGFKAFANEEAIRLKEKEEEHKQQKKVQLYSPNEVIKAAIRQEDMISNPYGIGNLRLAGFSDVKLLNELIPSGTHIHGSTPNNTTSSGNKSRSMNTTNNTSSTSTISLDPRLLWAYNIDLSLIRKKNYYSVKQLLEAGFTLLEMYKAGYGVAELYEGGVKIEEFLDIGLSLESICHTGGIDGKSKSLGLNDNIYLHNKSILSPSTIIKHVESSPEHLSKLGLSLQDLISANLSVIELRSIGFTAEEIYQGGITNIQEFIQAGFHLDKLISIFPLVQLKKAGYKFDELRRYAGVGLSELFQAGYVEDVERKVLCMMFKAMNGEYWYSKMNWMNSRVPIKQWFGITTQSDELHRERVTAIDLVNNNLQGKLPSELCYLHCLKRLRLGGNVLYPANDDNNGNFDDNVVRSSTSDDVNRSIPKPLQELIVKNQVATDVMIYSTVSLKALADAVSGGNNATNDGSASSSTNINFSKKLGSNPHGLLNTNLGNTSSSLRSPLPSSSTSAIITATRTPNNLGSIVSPQATQQIMAGMSTVATPGGNRPPSHPLNPADQAILVSRTLFDACFERPPSPREILMEFFTAMHGKKWKRSDNWGTNQPISTWYGVKVQKSSTTATIPINQEESLEISHQNIVEINLPENNLKGVLPDNLKHFTRLRVLDLRLNQISGFVPATINECSALTKLYLQSNKLSGLVPESLGDLKQLRILDLRNNLFHGDVPKSFEKLKHLQYLGLNSNKLHYANPMEVIEMLPACKIVL